MDDKLGSYLNAKLIPVYLLLLKMGARKEDAEDIVQETAYQFIRFIDGIEEEYAEKWLFRVAINKFYDLHRKKKRDTERQLNWHIDDAVEEQTPEHFLLQGEQQEAVLQMLATLQPKEVELLLLKYSAEWSLKDIATLMGTTDKTVKTQLARVKKKCQQYWKVGEQHG